MAGNRKGTVTISGDTYVKESLHLDVVVIQLAELS